MQFEQRFLCRPRHDSVQRAEAGFVSLLVLLQLTILIAFVLGISYCVRSGGENNADFADETAMRLAAMGEVERAGLTFERDAALVDKITVGERYRLAEIPQSAAGYRIVITALHPDAARLYLIGCALDKQKRDWERHKLVKGLWLKQEDGRYVFQGWTP